MYTRVIPRDLFNESKLLKCMGQLALLIHEGKGGKWGLSLHHINDEPHEVGFEIHQNLATGGPYVNNLTLSFAGDERELNVECDYNSKRPYPLLLHDPNVICDVFTDDGKFSEKSKDYLDTLMKEHHGERGT